MIFQQLQDQPVKEVKDKKQQLIAYYDDLKPESAYIQEVAKVTLEAEALLNKESEQKGLPKAAIFDFDDTLFSHYFRIKEDDFENDAVQVDGRYRRTDMAKITPVIDLYNKAQSLGVEPFVISYRISLASNPEKDLKPYIITNMKLNGMKIDDAHLFVPDPKTETHLNSNVYKPMVRKKIAEKGYRILFTIGDQSSDLEKGPDDPDGEKVGKPFLIPNGLYGQFSWLGTKTHVTGLVKPQEPTSSPSLK